MKSVLLVDDDEFILYGLTRAIVGHGKDVEVLTASQGKEALEILGRRAVDLVVTDLKMPVMNGYEVVEHLNRNLPAVPVFVMTGDYLPDVMPKFRTAEVSQFISKPFSFRQIAAEILAKLTPEKLAASA